ncbi:TMV resistance protein N-like [Dorcoceras hygrometricum]|uniref:TMV resistance protein N-like n=1 Tax=Dorcoceras hygrometricum TaxID=472368 RepID=A0A2Z7AWZ4_9LAMI|nr:TMV resistance protein N-like [Dorcoceras hygrometricum]
MGRQFNHTSRGVGSPMNMGSPSRVSTVGSWVGPYRGNHKEEQSASLNGIVFLCDEWEAHKGKGKKRSAPTKGTSANNNSKAKSSKNSKEVSTRRFDGYRPSVNTQSPSLARGSTMNETMKYKSIEAVNLLVSNTENSITQGNQKMNSKVFSVKSGLTVLRV